ncbi:MAG: sulfotransferase [Fimbriimonas sp.]|nr:sulfotransferase [Fimbriimonas sp.]
MPGQVDELLRLANAAHAAGRLAESEAHTRRVLAIEPDQVQAHLLLGVLAGKTGRNDMAFEHLGRVLTLNPESFEALFWLAVLHRRTKELEQALGYAERAVRLRPNDAHAHNGLGMCYLDLLRLEESAASFAKAASIRGDMAPIFHNLGTALHLIGRDYEAGMAFDRALMLAPHSTDSCLGLGQVMISQTQPDAAIACARKAIAIDGKSAPAQLLMASALVENNLTGEAEKHLKKAVDLNPQDAQAQALLGQRYQSLGRFEEANRHLWRSMELEPRQGFAYFAYVHNNKVTESDRPMVEKMAELAQEGGLPPREMDFLHYGLGRAYEGLREYERAMGHFDEANRLARKIKFGDKPFDREAYTERIDWLIQTFSGEFIRRFRADGCPSELPIVIVGMMRSGTTLCEQMLSSHAEIGGAGEDRFWPEGCPRLFGQNWNSFKPESLARMGKTYVDKLKGVAPGYGHVTDKNPANYEFLGPIHVALPNARIVHMRRNALDTCVSIYATPNRVPVDFAYDRGNIVFAYRQYLRLMEHWRLVLPEDRFIEVNYEDVVTDRRTQLERILNLAGLPWDDAMLHHESNDRNVNTPSLWQVRQPIYTTSIERWRRYEPWLGEFRNLMND